MQLDGNLIDEEHEKHEGKSAYAKKKNKRKLSNKLIEELTPVTIKPIKEFGIIRNVEDQIVRDEGYRTHA